MRHRKRPGKLNVSSAHHRAMRRNIVAALFAHGSIETTMAKAKAFRPVAEKLITLARRGLEAQSAGTAQGKAAHLHAIRRAAAILPNKPAVRRLFREVAPATGTRPGGYTRIVRLGTRRLGDNSPLALLMLVDAPAGTATEGAAATDAAAAREDDEEERGS